MALIVILKNIHSQITSFIHYRQRVLSDQRKVQQFEKIDNQRLQTLFQTISSKHEDTGAIPRKLDS